MKWQGVQREISMNFIKQDFHRNWGRWRFLRCFCFSTCQLRDLTDVKWSISSAADTFRLWSLRKKIGSSIIQRDLEQKKLRAYLSLEERPHVPIVVFGVEPFDHRVARRAPPSWLLHPKTHPHRSFEPPGCKNETMLLGSQPDCRRMLEIFQSSVDTTSIV